MDNDDRERKFALKSDSGYSLRHGTYFNDRESYREHRHVQNWDDSRRNFNQTNNRNWNWPAGTNGQVDDYSKSGRKSTYSRKQKQGNYDRRRDFENAPRRDHSFRNYPEETEAEIFGENNVTKGINFDNYDRIEVEVSGDNLPSPIESFEEVDNIHPQLLWNIDRCGYTKPTPVQKYAFSISVAGRDIMAVAQTGSGKTGAFLLPMAQILLNSGGNQEGYNRLITPIAIVLTPTRELAIQIQNEAKKFLFSTELTSHVVYGGVSIQQQRRQIQRTQNRVDVLVATPGRLLDYVRRGEISTKAVRFLVLDEADRMLDMGFEEQLTALVGEQSETPGPEQRQTMMFSATFPQEIQLLAQRYMGEYAYVTVGKVGTAAESVKQELVYAMNHEKPDVLLDFFDSIHDNSVLIFVQRKVSARKLEQFLKTNGIHSMSIHGDKSQYDREYAIKSFKTGICKVLVATDVASRGLDIPNVGFVVNYDMTSNIEDYVHRIGRTGRIGNEGVALTIICENDNGKTLEDLVRILREAEEQVPAWLENLIMQKRSSKGSSWSRTRRGRGRRGGNGSRYSRR